MQVLNKFQKVLQISLIAQVFFLVSSIMLSRRNRTFTTKRLLNRFKTEHVCKNDTSTQLRHG